MSYASVARYQHNDVLSMSPPRRLVFLYGQVLASLRQAARKLEEGDIENRSRLLTRAREIIAELLCTLDFSVGGEIAVNLASLYTWMMDETVSIDRHKDGKRLERLTLMVADLHGAWEKAAIMVSEAPAEGVAIS